MIIILQGTINTDLIAAKKFEPRRALRYGEEIVNMDLYEKELTEKIIGVE